MRLAPLLLVSCLTTGAAAATTLDVTLTGLPTQIDVYSPPQPTRGAVVLVHGFMRNRATMADHAQALANEGVLAVVPDMPYLVDSRDNARALVELVTQLRRGEIAGPIEQVVLVGFSAGGLAALLAASTPGVVGYVGLDAFDRPNGVGLAAARTLPVPSKMLRGPPSFCNAYGISGPWAAALPPPTEDRILDSATHCDFEAPTNRACTLFCGATDPQRQRIVRQTLIDAVREWLLAPARQTQAAPKVESAGGR
jgi:pimeloyl-ACP methyl ester carboxylesterase